MTVNFYKKCYIKVLCVEGRTKNERRTKTWRFLTRLSAANTMVFVLQVLYIELFMYKTLKTKNNAISYTRMCFCHIAWIFIVCIIEIRCEKILKIKVHSATTVVIRRGKDIRLKYS